MKQGFLYFCAFILWFTHIAGCCCEDYFLVVLVNARQLDYSCPKKLFKTIAKHPSDYSKNGDVGHAWIYLEGCLNGERVYVEGGHSGELGIVKPKYFDGIMNYLEYGYANPTDQQKCSGRYEPNPVKYMWENLHDGFFQWGSGGHTPTYAVKVAISEGQFLEILRYIENYQYRDYAITGQQCSSYVVHIAAIVGLEIDCLVAMNIDQEIVLGGECMRLWEDPFYSRLTFSSPDIIEASMKRAVFEGRAVNALRWYKRTHPRSFRDSFCSWRENITQFPSRLRRSFGV